jgi:hypothetical protein
VVIFVLMGIAYIVIQGSGMSIKFSGIWPIVTPK